MIHQRKVKGLEVVVVKRKMVVYVRAWEHPRSPGYMMVSVDNVATLESTMLDLMHLI